jgi:adenylate cyclase
VSLNELLARLIDGYPGEPGARIVRRMAVLVIPLAILANTAGAAVVFVFAMFVIPLPHLENQGEVLLANAIVGAAYLAVGFVVGIKVGWRKYRAATLWLREDRTPTEDEQRTVLREPARFVAMHALMWTVAAIVVGLLNLRYSGDLARISAITALIGGTVSSAGAFLMVIRVGRPVAARALAAGVPHRPVLPGITTRAVLAWVLGTGAPLIGLMLIALGELVGWTDVTDRELAVAMLGIGAATILAGLLVVFLSARSIADPVLMVRDAMRRVEQGDLEARVPVFDDSELGLLLAGFNQMAAGLSERELLRDLFGRHVGEDVAREALAGRVELGGELREVAVLFVDVIGSTTLAATRPATEVVALLNGFFDIVVDVVTAHGGWINKFEGDAALAVFGVPVARGDHNAQALAAGRELISRLATWNPALEAAVGISAGQAVAGNVGAERRYEYTVIGDPVNEAARLTELAKTRDCRVLASSAVLDRARDGEANRWRIGESVHLRGRVEPTRVAEPKT